MVSFNYRLIYDVRGLLKPRVVHPRAGSNVSPKAQEKKSRDLIGLFMLILLPPLAVIVGSAGSFCIRNEISNDILVKSILHRIV